MSFQTNYITITMPDPWNGHEIEFLVGYSKGYPGTYWEPPEPAEFWIEDAWWLRPNKQHSDRLDELTTDMLQCDDDMAEWFEEQLADHYSTTYEPYYELEDWRLDR